MGDSKSLYYINRGRKIEIYNKLMKLFSLKVHPNIQFISKEV